MKYLLDTNSCIEFLRHSESSVKQKLMQVSWGDVTLCSVVKAELYYGAQKSAQAERNLRIMREFLASLESLPFDDAAAEFYGQIRIALEKHGKPIGPHDLLIASIALAHGVTLITHNTDEFKRVSNLILEDWQA